MTSLSVCMPAYNEEENIAEMVSDVLEVMKSRFEDLEIVVTNDSAA